MADIDDSKNLAIDQPSLNRSAINQSLMNKWLISLSAFDRGRVYSLSSTLAEQSSTLRQDDFILQYALGKRQWQDDYNKMFAPPETSI